MCRIFPDKLSQRMQSIFACSLVFSVSMGTMVLQFGAGLWAAFDPQSPDRPVAVYVLLSSIISALLAVGILVGAAKSRPERRQLAWASLAAGAIGLCLAPPVAFAWAVAALGAFGFRRA